MCLHDRMTTDVDGLQPVALSAACCTVHSLLHCPQSVALCEACSTVQGFGTMLAGCTVRSLLNYAKSAVL